MTNKLISPIPTEPSFNAASGLHYLELTLKSDNCRRFLGLSCKLVRWVEIILDEPAALAAVTAAAADPSSFDLLRIVRRLRPITLVIRRASETYQLPESLLGDGLPELDPIGIKKFNADVRDALDDMNELGQSELNDSYFALGEFIDTIASMSDDDQEALFKLGGLNEYEGFLTSFLRFSIESVVMHSSIKALAQEFEKYD